MLMCLLGKKELLESRYHVFYFVKKILTPHIQDNPKIVEPRKKIQLTISLAPDCSAADTNNNNNREATKVHTCNAEYIETDNIIAITSSV